MYISTALLLMSLLSLSTAESLSEECENIKTMQQFDPVKYFSKSWYATYIMYTSGRIRLHELACLKNTFKLLEINVVREIGSTYIPKNRSFMFSECYINLAHFKNGTGKYTGAARIIDKDERPVRKEFHPTQHYVIHTDYDNYAVVFSCASVPNGRTLSIYKVLSRDPGVRVIRKVTPILKEIGLTLFDFIPIEHNNCVDGIA
uniref:Putative nitrophorin n=1 Tax=Panstrongylus lignarius TaxID=156445 RepID=A0A224XKN6_9HEMI